MKQARAGDILCQMVVTCANGEKVMFFDANHRIENGEDRDVLECARFENLMNLGVTEREEGPMRVVDCDVSRD